MGWIKKEGKVTENTYIIDSLLFSLEARMACYLIDGTKKKALIDASGKIEGKIIAKKLKTMNLDPDILILTHSHWDHAGGTNSIINTFPEIEVMASHAGITSLANLQDFNKWFTDYSPKLKPIENITPLKDEDTIDLGDLELRIFETPGHTNCSLSILDQKNGTLFIGDSLGYKSSETVFLAPIMPPEFSEKKLLSSINKIKKIDFSSICLAHFGYLTDDLARTFPDEAKLKFLFWKDFLFSKWKENPTKEHIINEMRKVFEEAGLDEKEKTAFSNMFGDWYIKGLKASKLI